MNQATQRFGRALGGGEDMGGLLESAVQLQGSPGMQVADTIANGVEGSENDLSALLREGGPVDLDVVVC